MTHEHHLDFLALDCQGAAEMHIFMTVDFVR
jgi:hypothetical protein